MITGIGLAESITNPYPVHSPVSILFSVSYSGEVPDTLSIGVSVDDGATYDETYNAIPFRDPLPGVRYFLFRGEPILKSLLGAIDDEVQSEGSLLKLDDFSKEIKVKAFDPDTLEEYVADVVIIHAAQQFGEVFDYNKSKTYFTEKQKPCYVYFYNSNPTGVVTVNQGNLTEEFAEDFDGEIFEDFNGEQFTILV